MKNKKNPEIRESFSQDAEKVADSRKQLSEEEVKRMKTEASEIYLYWWMTLDHAVELLLSKKWKWENCFIDFNWTKIYSVDTNSVDEAYLQYFWKTKAQVEMEREKERQEREIERKKKELEALEKIPWWVEEGKKYIDESKWEDWKKYVNSSARDMYCWMDIDATLELLKMIDNWESWDDVQKTFEDQEHSGYSYGIVRNRVVYFSKRWQEADKNLWRNIYSADYKW